MKNVEFSAFEYDAKHVVFGVELSWVRRLAILFSITLLFAFSSNAQIAVGLMARNPVSSVMISPTAGKYIIVNENNDTIYKFRSDDVVSFSYSDGQVVAKSVYGLNDTLGSYKLVGSGLNPSLKMRLESGKKEHVYFGSIGVGTAKEKLLLTNHVNIDRYVSMVVQAEVGYGAAEEYYKIQSIICRTYAMRNLERHVLDGYDVCDYEHCQVFSGLKQPTNEVIKATAATSGSVMVDPNNNLILSAFHANCGGQTANSEDVWKESRTYLTSVEDTFCLGSRSATWSKTLPLDEFLSQVGFPVEKEGLNNRSFNMPDRKKFFAMDQDSLQTAKMRRFLRLRSAYFNLDVKENEVHIHGRGYGHGVGVCQQGAMKMAESGYTYSQILGYYYKGVSLVPLSSLQTEK
ncbi:MAG: SpoIID/LytB domain-containing protein [Flavobacteriales bacterium]